MRQILALFVIFFSCTWAPLSAQRAETPETPPGSSGLPDLSGIWHRKGPLNGKPNPPAAPTNRAAGFEKALDDAYNPTYDCSATPIPGLINDNYDFQIMQLPDRVIIYYEKMDIIRTIWLEGHDHPAPAKNDYTNQGHSVGRWEDDRLVVEMTERYWREGNTLKLDSVTEDRLSLKQPYRYGFEWSVRTEPLTKYDCDPEDSRWGAQWHESIYPADK
jgi:hypothetical protein